jgi:urease accessory protein
LFADQNIALIPALTAYLHGAIANLVSAAQRLVPLGQTDGQLVLRDLRAAVLETAETLAALPDGDLFDQLGGCTLLAELGCMAHETQYTRLFRT